LQYSASQAAQPIKNQNRPRSSHPQPHIAPSFIVNRVNPISFVQLLRHPAALLVRRESNSGDMHTRAPQASSCMSISLYSPGRPCMYNSNIARPFCNLPTEMDVRITLPRPQKYYTHRKLLHALRRTYSSSIRQSSLPSSPHFLTLSPPHFLVFILFSFVLYATYEPWELRVSLFSWSTPRRRTRGCGRGRC
jgi:hypothetical protein